MSWLNPDIWSLLGAYFEDTHLVTMAKIGRNARAGAISRAKLLKKDWKGLVRDAQLRGLTRVYQELVRPGLCRVRASVKGWLLHFFTSCSIYPALDLVVFKQHKKNEPGVDYYANVVDRTVCIYITVQGHKIAVMGNKVYARHFYVDETWMRLIKHNPREILQFADNMLAPIIAIRDRKEHKM